MPDFRELITREAKTLRALQTPDLAVDVERLAAESDDGSVRARARTMLQVMAS